MVRVIAVGADAAKRGEFKVIPTGTKLKVALYEIEETVTGPNAKVPGLPQAMYTAKVTEEGEYKGREIKFNYVPLHGEGNDGWKLVTFADALGWDVDEEGNVGIPDNLSESLGTEFIARIGQSTSNKKNEAGEFYINNRVTGTLPLSKQRAKPEEDKPVW